jgi:hypothetical protein
LVANLLLPRGSSETPRVPIYLKLAKEATP